MPAAPRRQRCTNQAHDGDGVLEPCGKALDDGGKAECAGHAHCASCVACPCQGIQRPRCKCAQEPVAHQRQADAQPPRKSRQRVQDPSASLEVFVALHGFVLCLVCSACTWARRAALILKWHSRFGAGAIVGAQRWAWQRPSAWPMRSSGAAPQTHAHKVSPLKVRGPPHPNREPAAGRHLLGRLEGGFDLLACSKQVLPRRAGHALRSRLQAQVGRLSTSSQHVLQRTGIGRLQRDALRRSAPWRLGSNGVVALHHDQQNCDCIQYINPPREPLQQRADPAQGRMGDTSRRVCAGRTNATLLHRTVPHRGAVAHQTSAARAPRCPRPVWSGRSGAGFGQVAATPGSRRVRAPQPRTPFRNVFCSPVDRLRCQ